MAVHVTLCVAVHVTLCVAVVDPTLMAVHVDQWLSTLIRCNILEERDMYFGFSIDQISALSDTLENLKYVYLKSKTRWYRIRSSHRFGS
ncbi:hypothetical protein Q4574_15340 [Aliiglaciecola sp. 3_MG-2023]|uniref:hypothetical protein n=1 Tax=Aliiglaciecola sp. 3_MG-2023 TaxID=3062644 RepID=UPI0026E487AD|nr:hypothetical protein [Aliiglaciecola sp. 3_MG-2023]MDO6694670.1 hypothetical protein [Aliiglaciecola sp. 3_MG-2023]